MDEMDDILYQTFIRCGRDNFTLQSEVREALERVRLDYGHTDREPLLRGVAFGYVDAEEFNLACIEGARRHRTQDYQSSWDDKNESWDADTSGYDGYLKGDRESDNDGLCA